MAFNFVTALAQRQQEESEGRAHIVARFFYYLVSTVRIADGNCLGPALRSCVSLARLGEAGVEACNQLDYLAAAKALCVILNYLSTENLPAAGSVHGAVGFVFRYLTLREQQRVAQILKEHYGD